MKAINLANAVERSEYSFGYQYVIKVTDENFTVTQFAVFTNQLKAGIKSSWEHLEHEEDRDKLLGMEKESNKRARWKENQRESIRKGRILPDRLISPRSIPSFLLTAVAWV